MDAREASEERIRELEDDIKTLTYRAVERETELERYVLSCRFPSDVRTLCSWM